MPTFDDRLRSIQVPDRSDADAREAGRALRRHIPRSAHAAFAVAERDPLAIIAAQNADRLQDLVPLRIGRMVASPFTFYRGTAALMAHDLAEDTTTGLDVVACGDAHISNFGLYASPQRSIVFDLNDFDESSIAPWEWDVKRLVTSAVIGARANGFEESDVRRCALEAAESYRTGLREMVQMNALERYFRRVDTSSVPRIDRRGQRILDRAVRQAMRRTSETFLEKVAEPDASGRPRLIERPPVLTRVSSDLEKQVDELLVQYLDTVPVDIAVLLNRFHVADVARRVVGVGSVGTRCYIVVLVGPAGESLVLQVKEAPPSVLATYGGMPLPTRLAADGTRTPLYLSEGHRVTGAQRVLQAVSDPFLGHVSANGRDFYVRQFRDRKGSIDTAGLSPADFANYVDGCAALLARAHAQSASSPVIAGYLGRSNAFDRAVVEWSLAYADRSMSDYRMLVQAVTDGRMPAVTGV